MRTTTQQRASIDEAAWAAALRLRTFGYAEISREMKIGMERATGIVRRWLAEGAVFEVETEGARKMFRADADFVRLKGRTAEDNMWFAMRRLRGGFTPSDIAAHAAAGGNAVTVEEAAAYARALLAAGYLAVTRKAAPLMKREAIYRLVEETGPLPPVVARVRAVRDPNTGRVIVLGDMA